MISYIYDTGTSQYAIDDVIPIPINSVSEIPQCLNPTFSGKIIYSLNQWIYAMQ